MLFLIILLQLKLKNRILSYSPDSHGLHIVLKINTESLSTRIIQSEVRKVVRNMRWKSGICYLLRKFQSGAYAHWVKDEPSLSKGLNPPLSPFAYLHTGKFVHFKFTCKTRALHIKQSKVHVFPKGLRNVMKKRMDDKEQRVVVHWSASLSMCCF